MHWLIEPWTFPFMRWALLCCLVVASVHAYLGFHIVRRGVLFVDLAMAQAAAMGAAVGMTMGLEHDSTTVYILSAGCAVASGIFFALARSERIHKEAIVAAFYALAVAATFVVLERSPHGMEEVKHLFVGQVLTVSPGRVLFTTILYAVVGLAHFKMFPKTMAVTEGQKTRGFAEYFFFATFALVVTISVGLVGVLLVFAFLVLPSVGAIMIADRPQARLAWGWIIGGLASPLGLEVAYHMDMPAAPMIVLTLGALITLAALAGRMRRA